MRSRRIIGEPSGFLASEVRTKSRLSLTAFCAVEYALEFTALPVSKLKMSLMLVLRTLVPVGQNQRFMVEALGVLLL